MRHEGTLRVLAYTVVWPAIEGWWKMEELAWLCCAWEKIGQCRVLACCEAVVVVERRRGR